MNDYKVNSRTCRVYAAMEGIRPSDVARLMLESAAEIGWWHEDQLPRLHMIYSEFSLIRNNSF
jgi:hypothetical protein